MERIPLATETTYDLAVLGGGPAGYTCAIRAAQLGLKVAIIEKTDKLGGTCLHWGCIPTKSLLFSAEVWDHLKAATTLGIDNVDKPSLNWDNLLKRKNDITAKHTKGLDFLMKKNKITVVRGHGRLTGPASAGVFTVQVTDEDKGKGRDLQAEGFTQQTRTDVKAKKVVLAMGSDARMLPAYQADDTILTNMQILTLPKMPKSLIVIGSGAVGVEFASVFKSFGADVTVKAGGAASRRSRRRRGGLQGAHAPVQEARHRSEHRMQGREDREDQGRSKG